MDGGVAQRDGTADGGEHAFGHIAHACLVFFLARAEKNAELVAAQKAQLIALAQRASDALSHFNDDLFRLIGADDSVDQFKIVKSDMQEGELHFLGPGVLLRLGEPV